MSNSSVSSAISASFDHKDYVDAANDAAKRTRTVTIVLVVASVLIFIGWYNSVLWGWPIDRIRRAFDANDQSIYRMIATNNTEIQKDAYRAQLQQAGLRAWIENVRFVRIPFFGIAFDVNDLGAIGGLGFITILMMMMYSLTSEIKNLKISFKEAVHHNQLSAFYHALAMRQVFTVPHMIGEERSRRLAIAPKLVCILPAFIFSLGMLYDYSTVFISPLFQFKDAFPSLAIEAIWLFPIWYLSVKCFKKQNRIDNIWEHYWNYIQNKKTSVVNLDPDLVADFGSSDDVNKALRSLRKKSP